MANIYDMNAALNQPDIVGQYQKGQQFAQQRDQNANILQKQQQSLQDQGNLRALAPQVIAGDPNAYAQAAAIDPQAANQYQASADDQLRRLQGSITYLDQQKDPRAKEAAYQQQVRPYLARFGKEPPATFAEAEPLMEAARARIAELAQPKGAGLINVGAGGAVFDPATRQLVYQNPGVAKAPGIVAVNLPDGTTQQYQQLPDGSLAPLRIAGQGAPQAAPQGASTPDASDPMTAFIDQANQAVSSGVSTPAQAEEWLKQKAQEVTAQAQQSPSGLGRSAPKKSESTVLEQRVEMAKGMGATPEQLKDIVLGSTGGGAQDVLAPGDPTKSGEEYLATIPDGMRSLVQAIARGDQAPPSASSRSPQAQALLQAVYAYDPTASASNLPTRNATRKSFTSGKDAQNMTALSQLALHLDHLNSQIDTISGSPYLPNGLINKAEDRFNGKTTAFESSANAVAHELRSVFANASGGTQAELEENLKQLDSSNTLEQKRAAVKNIANLVHGRFAILQDKYSQGMGRTEDPFISSYPGAEETIMKLMGAGKEDASKNAGGWSIQKVQ